MLASRSIPACPVQALYSALKEQVGRASEVPNEEVASALAATRSEQMRGHFEFEQRARWVVLMSCS